MIQNVDLLFTYLDEQKSIFDKEKTSINSTFELIIQEYRSSIIQIGSIVVFIVTVFFGMITLKWIGDSIGQTVIGLTILISTIFIFSMEFFRSKFLQSKLSISQSYDNALWTVSELKRNLISNIIILENNVDTRLYYLFLMCVISSERVKIVSSYEEMLKIKIMRLKQNDFNKFYSEYEDIIKIGKKILDEFNEQFNNEKSLENILLLIEPLKNYKVKT